MKKSLKLLVLPTAMILLVANITSCAPSQKEIAMISDVGDIDDGSFNQGCWEAIQKYGNEKKRSYDYYRPFADSDFARECAIKQAVVKGAKVIILPGFKFGSVAPTSAERYPDVKFVLADNNIQGDLHQNLITITYDFELSGWLAGYAVCKDYFMTDWANDKALKKQYGFAYYGGMAYDSVYPYGYGFAEGILYAANEFVTDKEHEGVELPEIDIDHQYAGVFAQDDMACATVKGWLTRQEMNIQCVFPCGGKLYQSVTEAIKHYNEHSLPEKERHFKDQEAPRSAARWVGVDADQYNLVQDQDDKKCLFTSALKDIGTTVQVALDYEFNNEWEKLRHAMPEDGYVLGLNSRFVTEETKSEPKEFSHNYVGIPTEPKSETNNVLISFNHVTQKEILTKAALIDKKVKEGDDFIEVYHGKKPEFDETTGDLKVFNTDLFKKSQYNVLKKKGEEISVPEKAKYQGKVVIN